MYRVNGLFVWDNERSSILPSLVSVLNCSVPGDVQVGSLHDHLQDCCDFSVVLALK